MRELVLEYIDRVWEIGFEEEFARDQIDVHLMDDESLLKFFIDIARKY
jgi:hypothetical protein